MGARIGLRARGVRLAVLLATLTYTSGFALSPAWGDDEEVCMGQPATMDVSESDDPAVITGTEDRDVIIGTKGNDKIRGMGGEDVICGGPGDDTLVGGWDGDVLFGEEGDDSLHGGGGMDHLIGDEGGDVLEGGPGEDSLSGGDDDDTLVGNDDAPEYQTEKPCQTNCDLKSAGSEGDYKNSGPIDDEDDLDGGDGEDTCAMGPADKADNCED